jgi:hypothetical protein
VQKLSKTIDTLQHLTDSNLRTDDDDLVTIGKDLPDHEKAINYKKNARILAKTVLKMKALVSDLKTKVQSHFPVKEHEEDEKDGLIRELREKLAEKDRIIEELRR